MKKVDVKEIKDKLEIVIDDISSNNESYAVEEDGELLGYIVSVDDYKLFKDRKHESMRKLISRSCLKVTDNDWINLFKVSYKNVRDKWVEWIFVSRKEDPFNDDRVDGVVIVPIIKTKEGTKLVITKEFRVPLNDYEYGFPAGLVDPGMTDEETVKKELKEETGLDLVKIISKSNKIYASAGLTDESAILFIVEASGSVSTEHLEDAEDIKTFLYDVNDIKALLASDKKLGAKAWGVLYHFAQMGKIK